MNFETCGSNGGFKTNGFIFSNQTAQHFGITKDVKSALSNIVIDGRAVKTQQQI